MATTDPPPEKLWREPLRDYMERLRQVKDKPKPLPSTTTATSSITGPEAQRLNAWLQQFEELETQRQAAAGKSRMQEQALLEQQQKLAEALRWENTQPQQRWEVVKASSQTTPCQDHTNGVTRLQVYEEDGDLVHLHRVCVRCHAVLFDTWVSLRTAQPTPQAGRMIEDDEDPTP